MTTIWSRILYEAAYAAKQAPRIYFAPFLGAVKGARQVLMEVQQENRLRASPRRSEGANDHPRR